MLNLNDRAFRIDDVEIEHRIDLHRHVVARDHILGRDLDHLDAQIDAHHLLEERNQKNEARSPDALEAAEGKDDGPLILTQNLHARRDENEGADENEWKEEIRGCERHGSAPFRARADRLSIQTVRLAAERHNRPSPGLGRVARRNAMSPDAIAAFGRAPTRGGDFRHGRENARMRLKLRPIPTHSLLA
jgi:hypothetical protein